MSCFTIQIFQRKTIVLFFKKISYTSQWVRKMFVPQSFLSKSFHTASHSNPNRYPALNLTCPLLHTLLLLVCKIVENLQCIFKANVNGVLQRQHKMLFMKYRCSCRQNLSKFSKTPLMKFII